MNDNKKNINPTKFKIEYELENQTDTKPIELEIDALYEGTEDEIKIIKDLFSRFSQIVIAVEDEDMFTLIVHEGKAHLFQIQLEDSKNTSHFRQAIGILHGAQKEKEEYEPILIHTNASNREMACEILPGQPIFCKIEKIKMTNSEEYDRRMKRMLEREMKYKEKVPNNPDTFDSEPNLKEIDEKDNDHFQGETSEENDRTKKLFNKQAAKVIGIEDTEIFTRIEEDSTTYYHNISIPDTPASEVWRMGIHHLMNSGEEIYLHTSPNVKLAGFEFKPEENMPTALIVTTIEGIKQVDTDEVEKRAKIWLEKTTPKSKNDIEEDSKIQTKTKNQNPALN